MAITALTNSGTLAAQRSLGVNSDGSSKAISQISSGNKLTKASDDSAGAAISTKLGAVISTLEQANKNAAQGAALIQVVTGGLNSVLTMLTRMKTLTAQSNNDATSAEDRIALDKEYQKLVGQIDNIANQTRWSGTSLLNNTSAGTTIVNQEKKIIGSFGNLTDAQKLLIDTTYNMLEADDKATIYGGVRDITTANSADANIATAADIKIQLDTGEIFESPATVVGTANFGNATGNGAILTFTSKANSGNTLKIKLGADITKITKQSELVDVLKDYFRVGSEARPIFNVGRQGHAIGLKPTGNIQEYNSKATTTPTAGPLNINSTANQGISGSVSGKVKSVRVEPNGTSSNVYVQIGDQMFEALNLNQNATGAKQFLDQKNASNYFNLNIKTAYAATAAGRELFKKELEILFGLDPAATAPAEFFSWSAYEKNIFRGATSLPTTPKGDYSLTVTASGAGVSTFTLLGPDGKSDVKTIANVDPAGGTVRFDNGVEVTLGANFQTNTAYDQVIVSVGDKGASMDFQIAEKASDIINLSIDAATARAIGIAGTNVLTKEAAASASAAIDKAISAVNASVATLGAQQKQFEVTQENLSVAVENFKSVRSLFADADVADSMTNFTKFNLLTSLSQAMLMKSHEQTTALVQMAR